MPSASIKKIIPCSKKDLINMILDIEKYPEFVPWCLSGKIHRKDDRPDMIEMEADLTVGKKFLNQTYTSHVTYYKDKGKILVNNIGGPLKHLENMWEIKEIALSKGFLLVASSPLTRSSYHADEDFKKLKIKRDEQLKCQQLQ